MVYYEHLFELINLMRYREGSYISSSLKEVEPRLAPIFTILFGIGIVPFYMISRFETEHKRQIQGQASLEHEPASLEHEPGSASLGGKEEEITATHDKRREREDQNEEGDERDRIGFPGHIIGTVCRTRQLVKSA